MASATSAELCRLYEDLRRRISETVNIPLRAAALPGGIPAIRRQLIEFTSLSINNRHVFPPEQYSVIEQSLQAMLSDLDHIGNHVHDPPNNVPASALYAAAPEAPDTAQRRGRPALHFDRDYLSFSLLHRSGTSVAATLGCSARTIRRRLLAYGLSRASAPVFHYVDGHRVRNPLSRHSTNYARLHNVELDQIVASILEVYPSYGRRLVVGAVRTLGLKVAKLRIIASIRRVTERMRQFRPPPVQRRIYRVAGPNSIWHHDGQHGLIRWKIVVHAFIDGYSRYILGIRASNNNRSATVRDLFQECRRRTRATPHRCRGDCGMENCLVADLMAALRGVASYLWGRSVDNVRIERLWVDVVRNLVSKWSNFFADLEQHDGLDTGNPAHIWLLHWLFLDIINRELSQWADDWNNHPMDIAVEDRQISAHTAESPLSMYINGMIRNGVRGYDIDPESLGAAQDHQLEAPEPVDDLARYGVDEDALQQDDIVRSNIMNNEHELNDAPHFGPHRPTRFSLIDVLPPDCPFDDVAVLRDLHVHLTTHTNLDSNSMDVRRHWWIVALHYCQQLDA